MTYPNCQVGGILTLGDAKRHRPDPERVFAQLIRLD